MTDFMKFYYLHYNLFHIRDLHVLARLLGTACQVVSLLYLKSHLKLIFIFLKLRSARTIRYLVLFPDLLLSGLWGVFSGLTVIKKTC